MSEFRRRLMMAQSGGALPYDAEVEYLQGNRGPKINTGIISAQGLFEFDFVVACENTSTGQRVIIGADRGFNVSVVSSKYRATGQCISTINANINTFVHIIYSCNTTNGALSLVIDSNSFSGTYTNFVYGNELSIFGLYDNTAQNINAKVKSASIKVNGVLLRDYISVRVGTTGYLYDKVSGQLYGNVGTGSFTYGNDKN